MGSSDDPRLLGELEWTGSTDFALLRVAQEGCYELSNSYIYATSSPGEIALVCGTKHAKPTVRVERWDREPPPYTGVWEDVDEIPFREHPDHGPLFISGFDQHLRVEPGLDIAGLGRARVQVLASGRHVGNYGDDLVDQPEQWLLRFWSDPDAHDAVWGEPRRVQGLGDYHAPLTSGRAFVSAEEVAHVLRWTAPGDRQPSIREIADRLCMTSLSIREGLDTVAYLVMSRQEQSPFPQGIPLDDDTPLEFHRPPASGFAYDANPKL